MGRPVEIIKIYRSPFQFHGCRASYTCQSCGIEHIMDSGKAARNEIPPEGKRYIYGPCTCGHRCECLPEIRYEYVDDKWNDNLDFTEKDIWKWEPEYVI